MKTAVVYSPRCLDHNPGYDHPDTPSRLQVIMEELNRNGVFESERCFLVSPKTATAETVELVHEPDYVQLVERICASGGGVLDLGDTVVDRESFEVALLAVGGVLEAVDLVVTGRFENAFALVRPPGHHAGAYYAMGFCLFNNIAIAAKRLLRDKGLDRILILDVDAHHGNGTQEIFYDTDRVLYISLHQDPRGFPGTGFADEIGEGKGMGYTVNIPFPYRIDDQIYLRALNEIVVPIARQYEPQFILVSAGFDGHYTDPIGGLSLSTNCYTRVFSKTLDLAAQLCDGKLVASLEGGYSLSFLGKIATAVISKMADFTYNVRDSHPVSNPRTRNRAEQIIKDVRRIQSSFWSFDS